MNATTATPMAPVLQLVNTMIMSKGAYELLAETLHKKMGEDTPKASKPELQKQMNTIHATYKTVIQQSLTNIQAQYNIGSKIVEDLTKSTDLPQAIPLLQEFQAKITPLQSAFKGYENEIATLEGTLVSLMPINTTLDT